MISKKDVYDCISVILEDIERADKINLTIVRMDIGDLEKYLIQYIKEKQSKQIAFFYHKIMIAYQQRERLCYE